MIDQRFIIWTAQRKATSCILVLPGRGQTGVDLAQTWLKSGLADTMTVVITPHERCWYPMPFNPDDQEEAVLGLEKARTVIESAISRIVNEFSIPRHKIALVGFSAGGVMANYVACNGKSELAAVVCHAGAILEPKKVPICKHPNMKIVLTHSKNDESFNWQERYLPMRNALENKNYDLYRIENSGGGHSVYVEDVYWCAYLISDRLGYSKKWTEDYRKKLELNVD